MRDTNHIIGMELGLRTAIRDRRFKRDAGDVNTWLDSITRLNRSESNESKQVEDGVILGYLIGYRLGLSAWDGEESPLDRLKEYLTAQGIKIMPRHLGAA
ncbi:MAG: hypothetical protein SA339_11905 [Methanomassiliicoccus sp.]|nr:hypothetical protein [Methanomassiliicoccus sp.]